MRSSSPTCTPTTGSDFPGLLKTLDLRGRETPLSIHGPRGLRDLVDGVMRYAGATAYKLYVVELEPGEILERDGYEIEAVPVSHRGPAFGYVLDEHERPGVFDPAKAIAAGLTEGPEFGRVQRGETVGGVTPDQVMGPPRRGRKLAISGDTRPSRSARGRGPRQRPADPRGDVRDRGSGARPPDRPLDRLAGGRDRPRRRGQAARAQPPLDPLPGGAAARRGPRDLSRHGASARLRHDRDPVSRARPARAAALVRYTRRGR